MSRYGDKRKAFAREYIMDRSPKYAAIRAGYPARTADVQGQQLLKHDEVIKEIARIDALTWKRNTATIDELLSTLSDIARANVTDLFKEDGTMRSLKDIPEHVKRAISSISVKEHYLGGELAGVTHRIKMSGKQEAIDKMLKVLGAYERDNMQKNAQPVILQFNPLEAIDQARAKEGAPVPELPEHTDNE